MRKGIIYRAIQERKITIFIVIILSVLGLYHYYISPKQEAPDLNASVAIITTVYPGASPEDVERLVTSKIEDEIVEISGYDYSTSDSLNNLSVVVLRLEQDADISKAWDDLRQKMQDLQGQLPEGCQDIQINTDVTETAGMIISLSGENYTYEELASYAEDFKRELEKIDGVARFELDGKPEKQVKIEVDFVKLQGYHLSLEDIVQIIQAQNVEIPLGKIENEDQKINVRTKGAYQSLEQIENTIVSISLENGAVLRLKDMAKIQLELEDSTSRIKQNGKNAVLLTGYFKENKNIVIIGKQVEKKLEELKENLPSDMIFDQVHYQPKDVGKAVNDFILNLLEGVLFVIAVVFIGMGLRNAVIVSTAIPLSILITFIAMGILNIKIHQISIAALIIALGMLVDNAIVVSDAIQVRLDEGESRLDACINGVKEVAIPILTSTLTTIGAFIPLLLLPSMAGEYINSIPKIVAISLFASYITALFVTPSMAYMFFEKSNKTEKISKVRLFFDRLLDQSMRNKRTTAMIALAATGATILIAMQLGLQFFPKADKNILYIDITTEQSGNIDKTEKLADEVAEILNQQEEVISHTVAIGRGIPKFYDTLNIYTQSEDFAQFMIRVDLKKTNKFRTNTQLVDHLQERFDSKISGGSVIIRQLEQGEPIGSPVRVRIVGKDMERLEQAAREIKEMLSSIEGTINIEDDYTDKIYEFDIQVDADKAMALGISKYGLQKEVSMALRGQKASIFRKAGEEYDIIVKSNIRSIEELENLSIKSSISGSKIVLKQIAEVKLKAEIPNIKKYDREKAIVVFSDVRSGYSPVKIQNTLSVALKNIELQGVEIVFDGEKEKILEHFGNMGVSSVFAVMVVYGILLIQFRSFSQPLIILLTIPLSAMGSIWGLFIFRQPLSFTGLLGIVSLLGIVVNNAIILLDYMNYERALGKDIEKACLEAVGKRFRPIMLSTTTTVIGLTPLLFTGSDLFRPMAISLMSGLMVSTLLTLVVIPVVYYTVERRVKYNNQ